MILDIGFRILGRFSGFLLDFENMGFWMTEEVEVPRLKNKCCQIHQNEETYKFKLTSKLSIIPFLVENRRILNSCRIIQKVSDNIRTELEARARCWKNSECI